MARSPHLHNPSILALLYQPEYISCARANTRKVAEDNRGSLGSLGDQMTQIQGTGQVSELKGTGEQLGGVGWGSLSRS